MTTEGVIVYLSTNALTLASPDRLPGGTTYIIRSEVRDAIKPTLLGRRVRIALSGFMQVDRVEVLA